MTAEIWGSFFLGMLVAALAGLVLVVGSVIAALNPRWFVKGLGRMERARQSGKTDSAIDLEPTLPWDRYLVGSNSDFVKYAPEEPERFPRLILFFRWFFIILASFSLFLFVSQVILLVSAATG